MGWVSHRSDKEWAKKILARDIATHEENLGRSLTADEIKELAVKAQQHATEVGDQARRRASE